MLSVVQVLNCRIGHCDRYNTYFHCMFIVAIDICAFPRKMKCRRAILIGTPCGQGGWQQFCEFPFLNAEFFSEFVHNRKELKTPDP